jgi:predicted ribonuclease YlaK
LVEKAKTSNLVGHIHLSKSLRSPLADWAVENL